MTGPEWFRALTPRSEHDCLCKGALSSARSLATAVHFDESPNISKFSELIVVVSADGIKLYLDIKSKSNNKMDDTSPYINKNLKCYCNIEFLPWAIVMSPTRATFNRTF